MTTTTPNPPETATQTPPDTPSNTAHRPAHSARKTADTPHGRAITSLLHTTRNHPFGGDSTREQTTPGIAGGAVQDNPHRRSHTP
ncbi:hypothetical protein ACIBU0_09955 [Streptomyces sp. NPDC049627]|uniref:hypothetical protein n=1 Tax=Streptomyces sp. NPDC049627 TaxID=3365595 RepID=UPI0037966A76